MIAPMTHEQQMASALREALEQVLDDLTAPHYCDEDHRGIVVAAIRAALAASADAPSGASPSRPRTGRRRTLP